MLNYCYKEAGWATKNPISSTLVKIYDFFKSYWLIFGEECIIYFGYKKWILEIWIFYYIFIQDSSSCDGQYVLKLFTTIKPFLPPLSISLPTSDNFFPPHTILSLYIFFLHTQSYHCTDFFFTYNPFTVQIFSSSSFQNLCQYSCAFNDSFQGIQLWPQQERKYFWNSR